MRLRRNRRDPWSRKLVAERVITADDLIWPAFVHDEGHKKPIPSMPRGVFRLPIAALADAAGEAAELGIPTVAVFPAVPHHVKAAEGSEAVNPRNLVCIAVAALKEAVPDLGVVCTLALDPSTTHGHDGVIRHLS
jgi:porphobilinogen synthase